MAARQDPDSPGKNPSLESGSTALENIDVLQQSSHG